VFDAVYGVGSAHGRLIPELRFVNRYHDDAGCIRALAGSIARYWKAPWAT
jgi:ferrochelatase